MKVVPGADGWPEAYEYTVAGRTIRIADEPVEGVRPILHMRFFHAADDHYGLSPLEPAATAIDLHNTAAQWNVVPKARHRVSAARQLRAPLRRPRLHRA